MQQTPRFVIPIVLFLVMPATAQQRPDLSGEWIYSTDRSATPTTRPNFGAQFVAKQTPEGLTVDRTADQTTTSEDYRFDGTETRVARGKVETAFKTSWDGMRLVVHVTNTGPGENGTTITTLQRRLMWLEAPDTLVVESVITAPVQRPAWTSVYKRMHAEQSAASAKAAALKPARATLADVSWIAGTWIGGRGALSLEERWTPAGGGAMLGVSRTVKEGKMVAFEFLRIVERNGGLVYVAQPNGVPPTEFTLTSLDATTATFENPAHDYPRMIRYAKQPDGSLEARISADGGARPQTFQFKRQEH